MEKLSIEQKAKAYDEAIGMAVEALKEEPVKEKRCMFTKDNYTDEDRKVLCDGCEEECRFNKKEEPVSENLEKAIDTYLATYFGGEKEKQEWPFLKKMAIHFANWQKQKDSIPVSEDLEEVIRKYEQRLEKENPATEAYDFAGAIRFGAKWYKQQLMAKAVDAVVKVDAGGYPYIDRTIELYDYDKDIPLAKKGDKYKVILIKEDYV